MFQQGVCFLSFFFHLFTYIVCDTIQVLVLGLGNVTFFHFCLLYCNSSRLVYQFTISWITFDVLGFDTLTCYGSETAFNFFISLKWKMKLNYQGLQFLRMIFCTIQLFWLKIDYLLWTKFGDLWNPTLYIKILNFTYSA